MRNRLARFAAVGAAGVVGIAVLTAATSASASTPRPVRYPVVASTSSTDHPDTTSTAGTCTVNDPSLGPVWAYDSLTFTFKVVPEGTVANRYVVTIKANGTFKAVADPITGNCAVHPPKGTLKGTITYVVDSPNTPRAGYLPRVEPSTTGQSAMITQLFGGTATISGGGSYSYTYHKTAGTWSVLGNFYTQVG